MDILTRRPQGQLETNGLINHLDRFKMMTQATITKQNNKNTDEHYNMVCAINQCILSDR